MLVKKKIPTPLEAKIQNNQLEIGCTFAKFKHNYLTINTLTPLLLCVLGPILCCAHGLMLFCGSGPILAASSGQSKEHKGDICHLCLRY